MLRGEVVAKEGVAEVGIMSSMFVLFLIGRVWRQSTLRASDAELNTNTKFQFRIQDN